MIRTVVATRYVTPLREGGSLPAIVEGDDLGTYVLKFRGAGQGQRALIAELLAGEIARALGLPVPEIVRMEVDPLLARSEPDGEVQDLVEASAGLNLALDYLPGSFAYDPLVGTDVDPVLASRLVWFDAYVSNVDRTPRNTNLLIWHKQLYLIDHGAALYFHHSWSGYQERAHGAFPQIKGHVLLPLATDIAAADAVLVPILTPELIAGIVALIPDSWLGDEPLFPDRAAHRAAYATYLTERLAAPRAFVEEAIRARAQLV